MTWQAVGQSDSLTLSGIYAVVQESSSDLVITLNPGELLQVLAEFNPQAAATENCDLVIQKSLDGIDFETSGEAARYIIDFNNREADDPAKRSIEIVGVHSVRFLARVRDTDDTVGGTDITSALTIHYRKDGVNL